MCVTPVVLSECVLVCVCGCLCVMGISDACQTWLQGVCCVLTNPAMQCLCERERQHELGDATTWVTWVISLTALNVVSDWIPAVQAADKLQGMHLVCVCVWYMCVCVVLVLCVHECMCLWASILAHIL